MKASPMGIMQRFSVSLENDKGAALRALVDEGTYPSITSVFDAAVEDFLELERERKAWRAEIVQRCKEALAHPERLLDADEFFRGAQEEIDRLKASRRA